MNLPAVSGLDLARGRVLSALAPIARPLFRDRELRVVLYGLFAVIAALAATAAAPMLLLAVGPIVLGIPHLVADVRYLVARPALHRRSAFWIAVALPAAAAWLAPHAWVGMLALFGGALIARAPVGRRIVMALASATIIALAARYARFADFVIAHAHNAIAVALWCAWARRRSRSYGVVVAAAIAGSLVILLGGFDGGPFDRLVRSDVLRIEPLVASLSPFRDSTLAVRLVLFFAFAQSIHYAVWVRLVPEDDRPKPGLRPFASSLRALATDLGPPLVVLAGAGCALLAIAACVSLVGARDGYLRLAMFHGPLELGAAMMLFLEGRLPLERSYSSASGQGRVFERKR